jgi:hypothetical protein
VAPLEAERTIVKASAQLDKIPNRAGGGRNQLAHRNFIREAGSGDQCVVCM